MNFNHNDTICAISTPHGRGGIAVVRVSGPKAIETVDTIWKGKPLGGVKSHTAHLGDITDTQHRHLDQALVTVFRAPASFTGEDVVEISVHGSLYIQQELIATLVAAGARLAGPGEFTRRAFVNGKLDLAQAEAVADIIAADSRAAHRIAASQMKGRFSQRLRELRLQLVDLSALLELELDFSEEHVEFASRATLRELAVRILDEVTRLHDSFAGGRAIKNGIPVAIVGQTNAGKSSLLNALVGDDRAIVSDIHGTTRDTIEETLTLGDYLFRFIDTAGLRNTDDKIEQIGISRSLQAMEKAHITIVVVDSTQPGAPDTIASTVGHANGDSHIIVALNKTDIADINPKTIETIRQTLPGGSAVITVSASTGSGLDTLTKALEDIAALDENATGENIIVTNQRHATALGHAADSTRAVIDAIDSDIPADLIAQDLRQTIDHLASITGDIPSNEILSTIFSRFCIGK